MKGDFSRFTFDRRKHYADVRLQQGRVQLDADWNEQADIAAYQRHTLAADVIGRSGAPDTGGGFQLELLGNTLRITPGRYYVDGLLCENEEAVPIDGQPHLPEFDLPAENGDYLAYLDVWQRSVTALEDPDLLELALKGADTATRLRTVWQVKLHKLDAGQTSISAGWEPDSRPRPILAVRAAGAVTENQLYRIEVHKPGALGVATFKWSRDNGSVAALIENPANEKHIQVTQQIGPDQAGGFETGHWIEAIDETRLLKNEPGVLARLSSVAGQVLVVEEWPGSSDTGPDLPNDPQIRRWDSDADQIAQVPTTNGGYIDLDGTLEASFAGSENAYFRTGDYWVIPVRAGAGVRWPTDGSGAPLSLPPHGVQHHYAPLYLLQRSSGNWTITSPPYRKVFQARAGEEKLNRTADDRMTASLTITGNLSIEREVTVGQALVLATGAGSERGLLFPSLGGASAFLRYDNPGGAPRLTLGAESPAALALHQGGVDQITLTGNGVTIGTALTYRDGSQSLGRVLTSDAGGRATWKAPIVFVRIEVDWWNKTDPHRTTRPVPWTFFDLSSHLPSGVQAQAVILEAEASKFGPNSTGGDPNMADAYIRIRPANATDEGNILLRGRAFGDSDNVAWSNQGVFPLANNAFHYTITHEGFQVWNIRVVGYIP